MTLPSSRPGRERERLIRFVVPLLLHAVWPVLACYVASSFGQGIVLSIVFQMAH